MSSHRDVNYSYSRSQQQAARLGPVTDRNELYYSTVTADPRSMLSSSEPGRRAPSIARTQKTDGYYMYPSGLPLNTEGLRPQSSSGKGYTPSNPRGVGYTQSPTPFEEGTRIHRDYYAYKAGDERQGAANKQYKEAAKGYASTSKANTVGGRIGMYRYTKEGHAIMEDYAHEGNISGLAVATGRLEHLSDNFGRLPRESKPGHLKQAEIRSGDGMAKLERQHRHYAQGGTPREYAKTSRDWEL